MQGQKRIQFRKYVLFILLIFTYFIYVFKACISFRSRFSFENKYNLHKTDLWMKYLFDNFIFIR